MLKGDFLFGATPHSAATFVQRCGVALADRSDPLLISDQDGEMMKDFKSDDKKEIIVAPKK